MGTLYRQLKVKLNAILDRIIEFCDLVLMQAYPSLWLTGERAQRSVRALGNACWLLNSFPRQTAYQLAGNDWNLVYVGRERELVEICQLFFPGQELVPQRIGRVPVWSLARQTEKWLEGDVDLVIVEQISTWRLLPRVSTVFRVPTWIQQELDLGESLDAFFQGGDMRTVRHKLNIAAKANFEWYHSRAEADYDLFYHQMYVPYVTRRHGERVLVTPYRDQKRNWFSRNGLIVITQDGRPVGGLLCQVRGRTCYLLEMGVRDGDPDLMQQQIDTFIYRSAVEWGYQQGARFLNMGAGRAYRTDGVFIYKSRWRARVVERSRIYSVWNVAASSLPRSLRARLQELGLIALHEGGFYGVFLDDGSALPADIEKQDAAAQRQGLAGLLVLRTDESTRVEGRRMAPKQTGAAMEKRIEDTHSPGRPLVEGPTG